MISEPMVRSARIVHLSCVKISSISKQNETSIHLSLVTLEYHRVQPKWFLILWYGWRKPCTFLATTLTLCPNGPKHDSTWPTHQGVPSGASKMISEPMVWSAQTVHLCCVNTSTISKRTESSIHLSLVSWEYQLLRPKGFLSLWYV
jgi:hypothetical protein